ncbi:uncharacterized protein METZ01_LOCUS465428, partial [marine metagenome]
VASRNPELRLGCLEPSRIATARGIMPLSPQRAVLIAMIG